jgi:hypothetical protein
LAPRIDTPKPECADNTAGPAVILIAIDLRLATVDPTAVTILGADRTPKHTVLGTALRNRIRPRDASIRAGATVVKIGEIATTTITQDESSRTDARRIDAGRASRTPRAASPTVLLVGPEVRKVYLAEICHLTRHNLDAGDGDVLPRSFDCQINGARWEVTQFEGSARSAERRLGATWDRHTHARNRSGAGDYPSTDRPCIHQFAASILHHHQPDWSLYADDVNMFHAPGRDAAAILQRAD